jgi:hypothetical protein
MLRDTDVGVAGQAGGECLGRPFEHDCLDWSAELGKIDAF